MCRRHRQTAPFTAPLVTPKPPDGKARRNKPKACTDAKAATAPPAEAKAALPAGTPPPASANGAANASTNALPPAPAPAKTAAPAAPLPASSAPHAVAGSSHVRVDRAIRRGFPLRHAQSRSRRQGMVREHSGPSVPPGRP